jgi:hypothetical protein
MTQISGTFGTFVFKKCPFDLISEKLQAALPRRVFNDSAAFCTNQWQGRSLTSHSGIQTARQKINSS